VRERDVERFFRGFGRIREILLKNGYGFIVSNILFSIYKTMKIGSINFCSLLYFTVI
jgi:hypothetical protein